MQRDFDVNSLHQHLSSVQGQILPKEAYMLYSIAREVPNGTSIVEIGSYRGKSTVALALGVAHSTNEKVQIFAIDPHQDFEGVNQKNFGKEDQKAFYESLVRYRVGHVVSTICLPSKEVSLGWDKNRKISILWIDGDHSYGAVKSDLDSFEPHLLKNSTVLFHDSYLENVQKVIEEAVQSGRFQLEQKVGTITSLKYSA